MATDFNKPAIGDNYSTGYTQALIDNQKGIAKFLDSALETVSNPVTGLKRYNSTNDLFEQYSGGWSEMPLAYLKLAGGTVTGAANFTGGLSVNANGVWHAGNLTPGNYALLSGAAFTGAISTNSTNAITAGGRLFGGGGGGNGLRQITVSTSDASGGSQGDVWFKY